MKTDVNNNEKIKERRSEKKHRALENESNAKRKRTGSGGKSPE